MKILFCSIQEAYCGGAEIYKLKTIFALRNAGLEVAEFQFRKKMEQKNGFKVWGMPVMPEIDHDEFMAFIETILIFKPAVIHVNKQLFVNRVQRAQLKNLGIPVVLTVHDYFSVPFPVNLKNIIKEKLLEYCWFADHYIIPSKMYFNQLLKKGVKHIIHIPHFVETKDWQFHSEKKIDQHVGLLYVGRFEEEKGIFLLLKAVAQLVRSKLDVTLTMIGDGSKLVKLNNEIEKMNLSAVVTIKSYADSKALKKYFDNATLLVLPTLKYELFGLVGIEAQASGLPVCASNLPGIREWCRHGLTGTLFHRNDQNDLCQKIKSMLTDEKLYHSIRHTAFKNVQEKFSAPSSVGQLIDLYKQIAHEIS